MAEDLTDSALQPVPQPAARPRFARPAWAKQITKTAVSTNKDDGLFSRSRDTYLELLGDDEDEDEGGTGGGGKRWAGLNSHKPTTTTSMTTTTTTTIGQRESSNGGYSGSGLSRIPSGSDSRPTGGERHSSSTSHRGAKRTTSDALSDREADIATRPVKRQVLSVYVFFSLSLPVYCFVFLWLRNRM